MSNNEPVINYVGKATVDHQDRYPYILVFEVYLEAINCMTESYQLNQHQSSSQPPKVTGLEVTTSDDKKLYWPFDLMSRGITNPEGTVLAFYKEKKSEMKQKAAEEKKETPRSARKARPISSATRSASPVTVGRRRQKRELER